MSKTYEVESSLFSFQILINNFKQVYHFFDMQIEISWEVCNQQGGIYTVLRSKVMTMLEHWGLDNYFLIGPYIEDQALTNFEEITSPPAIWQDALTRMRQSGYRLHFGQWAVTGKPFVILLDPSSCLDNIGAIKYQIWDHHRIPSPKEDHLLNQIIAFGFLVGQLLKAFEKDNADLKIIAHFHEWLGSLAIPLLRASQTRLGLVFTTHATLLGRYLAMNDPNFYEHLAFYDWINEAHHFNIETAVRIERAAAHGAHYFTTVSAVTAKECQYLLGREVDKITPNGINIKRFEAIHQFQNLHLKYKNKINEFVTGHFFPSYDFDLDKTLYFFTSGRYEYKNKGFDLIIEALARLNHRLKTEGVNVTIVMFFITRQPYHSYNSEVMKSRAIMSEITLTCKEIAAEIEQGLFEKVSANKSIDSLDLKSFISQYNLLKLKRTLQSWKIQRLPSIVTHNLVNDSQDQILVDLRRTQLINNQHDKVKVIYHPDFLSYVNPLFGMEYNQFVRGCHLGIFPSYYEPWGYTPLECTAMGIPSITSDLTGFGNYVAEQIEPQDRAGIYIVERQHKTIEESIQNLTDYLFYISTLDRRSRINLRNQVENSSNCYDWSKMIKYYQEAYDETAGWCF